MSTARKPSITVIGDSTIDNKAWIAPGIVANVLRTKLGIKRDILFKLEYSVVEHLQALMPNYTIYDESNDGFTTTDILTGAFRDKVFGQGRLDMYPHTWFSPLADGENHITDSEVIILSIGGNNIREFLQQSMAIDDTAERRKYIKNNFDPVLKSLKKEYIDIVRMIRHLNSKANIILMTQYYPSIVQNKYHIYDFMNDLGTALHLGSQPTDTIHLLMKKMYKDILQSLDQTNLAVVDITSSLNPFDATNHTSQIEPSGEGGRIIATLLSHVIQNRDTTSGKVFRIQPDNSPNLIESIPINDWTPKHPHTFTDMDCHKLLKKIANAPSRYRLTDRLLSACRDVHNEGVALLNKVSSKEEAANLKRSLDAALKVLANPTDKNAIADLKDLATTQAAGKPSMWKKFVGALMMLAGIAAIALNFAGIPMTDGLSAIRAIGGAGSIIGGATLFYHGRQQSLSNSLHTLAESAELHPVSP